MRPASLNRVMLVLAASLPLLSCSDTQSPLAPEVSSPDPMLAISDARHEGGNEHFFWLPPMVEDPDGFNGAFNGAATPTVEICLLNGAGTECDGTQPAGLPIMMAAGAVPAEELYSVNWHTNDSNVSPGSTYRISVVAGDTEMGFADVAMAASGGEAKNLSTDHIIGLKDGRTLPIKFRLEDGVPIVITPEDGGTVEALGGEVTVEIPPGALDEETPITAEPLESEGDALVTVEFGPDGLQFEEPVEVTLDYDEEELGDVDEEDLALRLLKNGRWIVLPGSFVDPATNTVTAPLHHFSEVSVGEATLALYCSGDADPDTYESLDDAILAVMDMGTVEVCAGTHTLASPGLIDKPMTLQGAAGSRPTLTTTDTLSVLISDFTTDSATIRNLELETGSAAHALYLWGSYGEVLVDSVDMVGTNPTDLLILAGPTTVSGARTTVQHSSFTAGQQAVWADSSAIVDVLNSTFSGQANVNLGYNNGASGLIQDNAISPCGSFACILFTGSIDLSKIESARIIGNSLTATAPGQTSYGIRLGPDDMVYEVTGNTITGVAPTGDRNQNSTYSFSNSGIYIVYPETTGDISNNTIFGARDGLRVRQH
jgi:hypothetical protein